MKRLIICVLFFNILIFIWSFKGRDIFKTIEAEEVIVRKQGSISGIYIRGRDNGGEIFIKDKNGENRVIIKSNKEGELFVSSEDGQDYLKISSQKNRVALEIFEENINRLFLKKSGIFLKNKDNNVIASFARLSNGEGGFGVGDKDGMASIVLKGGKDPSFSIFSDKVDPVAIFGSSKNIPHLMISGNRGNEGILIHGGDKSGLMLLNEKGELELFICKEGIFQDKKTENSPKQGKLFSLNKEKKILFPRGD